ncbi:MULTISPECIES: NAD(P)H-binding protein [Streptomyces]|uniref:NmrA family NAD(P)-binding protein n=1 Tax=Streptomyces TaxID=1883 RepID=UPI000F54F046|nr:MULTISPECIES: NAD(P)H-binding protein [Streptomyces]RPK32812.1 NAD(P)H azoreductase [Streptomyces sp. ADI91-18]WSS02575.1 NAD(P)H-binding protein [Streptomyces goshikiensis]
MTESDAILVTGATGTTGSRLVARLAAAGLRVTAAGRSATAVDGARAVRFDWDDPDTYGDALAGADRVYLIPPPGSPDPAAVMLPFLRRARAAGVRRAVLLSSSAIPAGGPAVGRVHQALPGLFDEWAVLRPSWFMQNFTGDHAHAHSVRSEGVIRTAAGEGRVGFVDAEDIAAVAFRALTDTRAPNTDLILTGPSALNHREVAEVLSEVTGRSVVHEELTPEQMRDRLAAFMPAEFAALLADMDRAIAAGAEDRTTDAVRSVTGLPPLDFRAVALREAGRSR